MKDDAIHVKHYYLFDDAASVLTETIKTRFDAVLDIMTA
mgnify:CR=1 FL=1